MRNLGMLVLAGVLALVLARAADASETRYFGPAILAPGGGAGSAYDTPCARWVTNDMTRNVSSVGTVTFIDTAGGWHFTATSGGTETLSVVATADWTKKAHCYNSWSYSYWANCWRGALAGKSCSPV